ncbi:unnamed protein product [Linum tenue]|uniref:cysteine--tRNA ligase n=1 Tax=Linum tenue TaxID=586396 RepID=A0AAV0K0A6_9ROSI|nr:unnamed protein product [Linum tenue]
MSYETMRAAWLANHREQKINMATLFKYYKPLCSSIRFTSPFTIPPFRYAPNRTRPPRTVPVTGKRRQFFSFFSSLTSSLPVLNENNSGPTSGDGAASPPSELWLYNTMTRKKELFKSKLDGKVGMYVCGVTAYDLSHIGHARVYVTFDVLYRYLRHLGYDVSYVRNFTDVDDKIIARANEVGEDPISLSRRYCEEFHQDMVSLHCLPPSVEPRVSDHMPQIVDMINKILDNGCAYRIDGDVYFSVDKFPQYGRLSGRKLEDNRAGERIAVDTRKRNPADFALWKSAKEGEPSWQSPWGPGRPGWHIECSAMSAAYLGHSFDIHGGGMDLVFPHHENEIAQSCAACGDSNISYWVHNGFVTVDSEKMSKSLGNFFTIRQTLYDCENVIGEQDAGSEDSAIPPDTMNCIVKFNDLFAASMSDDLHTPVVLAAISDPLKIINDMLHTRKGKKQAKRIESLSGLGKIVQKVLTILGLMPTTYSEVLQQLKEKALRRAKLTEDQVIQKIHERTEARKNKDYEKSDAIRKELSSVGIALMDNPDGTTWRPAVPLALQELEIGTP